MIGILGASDLVELFTEELTRCALRPSESLVILSEPTSREDYVGATFAAAKSLGLKSVASVTLPGGSPVVFPGVRTGSGFGLASLGESPHVLELLKSVDMVVDLTLEGHIHAEIQQEILRAETRILFVCDPPEVLARNLTGPADKARALAARDRLRGASEMTVTSEAGTDLHVDVTNAHPGYQCGFADDAGRWDHWPSCMVVCWPRRADGQVVLAQGDILFPFKEYVSEPIILTVADSRVQKVVGGEQALKVAAFCDEANDASAQFTSHMGWGLMPTADWLSLALYDKESLMGMDGRSYEGNFLISTGPNPFAQRVTPFHLDIPMRDCTINVDHCPVVVRGMLVA
jgi:2,5-dihydroxypyridine 5,6-dioxygenase